MRDNKEIERESTIFDPYPDPYGEQSTLKKRTVLDWLRDNKLEYDFEDKEWKTDNSRRFKKSNLKEDN